MKNYELTFLVHPDYEMNLDEVVEKVKKLISTNDGKVTKEVNEGKKRLAYAIKGQEYAVYYYMEVELPATAPAKISSVMNITDEVLRYLLVVTDERRIKMEEKKREYRANRAAAAEKSETQEEE
ncbi:30S ribosomal protein S6 [Candidatus Saccharibacteria bacterium]|nr:30S ribosomal protein S6 [Candidatus Saccharibacteria bacterium]